VVGSKRPIEFRSLSNT